MPDLRQAMKTLLETFDKYAGGDGDSKTLTKAELAELLRKECPQERAAEQCAEQAAEQTAEQAANQTKVDEFFKLLDADRDGVVDFKEYVTIAAEYKKECLGYSSAGGFGGAMTLLLDNFNKCAAGDGDRKTLTKGELVELLRKQLGMKENPSRADVEDLFKELDADRDRVVDFKEYVTHVAGLSLMCCKK